MSKDNIIAVVPAAGIGSRMQADVPKQYLSILDKTIIEHTLQALIAFSKIDEIIVVLHPEDKIFATLKLAKHPKIKIVIGGAERVDSVLAGLKDAASKYQAEQTWVLVHDAARPLVQHRDIETLLAQGKKTGAAILAIPSVDTLKQARSHYQSDRHQSTIQQTIDRRMIWQAQTPQMARLSQLIDAITSCSQPSAITDEASALEMHGCQVSLVEGSAQNIKITKPSDLALATFYLSQDK